MPVLLDDEIWFPPVYNSLDGIVAVGGDLRPGRLLYGYAQGIFPWYDEYSPILWWSPDPRCVLPLDKFKIPSRLSRKIKNGPFHCSFDLAFDEVIKNCAHAPRRGQRGTWLLPEMQVAYKSLHKLGFAHSVECWLGENLVGGLYGVCLGKVFFGESMFYKVSDASKIALAYLVDTLKAQNFMLFDCQQDTPHMLKMGATCIARDEFCALLDAGLCASGIDVMNFSSYYGHIL